MSAQHSRRHLSAAPLSPSVTRSIEIWGCPIDLGAGRRGVDMGTRALRKAKMNSALRNNLGWNVTDMGDVDVPQIEQVVVDHNHDLNGSSAQLRADVILDVTTRLSKCTYETVRRGAFPLVLGGDHSIATGSNTGTQAARLDLGLDAAGIIWFDAHTDFNTPEISPSGNLHGMSLAALLGLPVYGLPTLERGTFDAARTAIVCVRSVDPGEALLLADNGLRVGENIFTMFEIDKLGMYEVMNRAIDIASAGRSHGSFALSLDMDAVDPKECPGTGTPVPGGATYREAHLAMEMIASHGGLIGMDVVEVNPILDTQNITAEHAVELTLSAMGQRIMDRSHQLS